jgi:hypothetical protein
MRRPSIPILAALALFPALAAAADYWEAKADHVVVIATGGARRAADLAGDFVRLEQAVRHMVRIPDSQRPAMLLVYALTSRDEQTYLRTAEDRRRGVDGIGRHLNRFFPMPLGGVVAFGGHQGYLQPLQAAYTQYAGYLIDTGASQRPQWYRRGVATLFSDVTVASSTNRVVVGDDQVMLPIGMALVADTGYRPLADILETVPDAAWSSDDVKKFAWRSYLVAHYGFIGYPHRREQLERYAQARVVDGRDPEAAREQAFGAELPEVEREFRRYSGTRVKRGKLTLDVAGPVAPAEVRAMSDEESRTRLLQLQRVAEHFEALERGPG